MNSSTSYLLVSHILAVIALVSGFAQLLMGGMKSRKYVLFSLWLATLAQVILLVVYLALK